MVYASLDTTAVMAWSPQADKTVVACGTVAGAMDATFSSSSTLNLYQILGVSSDSPHSTKSLCSIPSPGRVAPLFNSTDHTGAVAGLQFNPFQNNLIASGAANGEILIWDALSDFKSYSPGSRSSRIEDVTDLSWNNQVQQILATSSNSGATSVWDLRNRREVMSLAHSGNLGLDINQGMGSNLGLSRSGVSSVKWHPNSPTQLVTSLDDDKSPLILSWDLRNAKSPTMFFSGHSRGILSLSWSLMDPGLLLSSGKDNRTICWNTETGQILSELPVSNNWVFDVQWNQKNPNFLSTSSFEGKVNFYKTRPYSESSVAPSYVEDPFDINNSTDLSQFLVLKSPPKWLSRPCGASFGFGNKLISFNNLSKSVNEYQVVSDSNLSSQAIEFEEKLHKGDLESLCLERMKEATDKLEIDEWKTLSLLFQPNAREKLIEMLGFDKSSLKSKVDKLLLDLSEKKSNKEPAQEDSKKSKSKKNQNKKNKDKNSEDVKVAEDGEAPTLEEISNADADADADTVQNPFDVDNSNSSDLFLKSISKDGETLDDNIADLSISDPPHPLVEFSGSFSLENSEQEIDDLISKSLMLGCIEDAVSICIENDRFSDALVLAACSSPELVTKTQLAYFNKRGKSSPYVRLLYSIYSNDLTDVVRNSEIKEWPMVLSFICTYSQDNHFSHHCGQLGNRLETASAKNNDQDLIWGALLCYLVSGNVAKISLLWIKRHQQNDSGLKSTDSLSSLKTIASLHKFVEKLSVLVAAIDFVDPNVGTNQEIFSGGQRHLLSPLYDIYVDYAEFLVSQGLFTMCMEFLNKIPSGYSTKDSNGNDRVAALKYRLFNSGYVSWDESNPPSPDYVLSPIKSDEAQTSLLNSSTGAGSVNKNPTNNPQNFFQSSNYNQPPQNLNNTFNQNQFFNPNQSAGIAHFPPPPTSSAPYNHPQSQQQLGGFTPSHTASIPQIPKPQIQSSHSNFNSSYQNPLPPSPNNPNPNIGYLVNPYLNSGTGTSMASPIQPDISRPPINPPLTSMIPPPRPVNPQSIPTGATPPPQKEGAWNDPPMLTKHIKRSNPPVPKPPVISKPFPNGRSTPPLSQSSQNLAGSVQTEASGNLAYTSPPITSYNPIPPQFNQQQNQSAPSHPASFAPNFGGQENKFNAQPHIHQPNIYNPNQTFQDAQNPQPISTRGQVVSPPAQLSNRGVINPAQSANVNRNVGSHSSSKPQDPSSNLKYPSGDRSHMPEYWMPIYTRLQSLLEKCQKFVPDGQKRSVEDCNKRLQQLFDMMNNDSISKAGNGSEVTSSFSNLISSIESRNYHSANHEITGIMSSSSDLTSSMIGVKRMVEILKSLPV
ncbi:Protein transport protein sec31 [Smittium mucronatum]|uniref:Protein transport protein SEC31 n=1 Tax=Smittium mucronatum TaxID=133383 RepID=A0A1R0H4S8_9FUNG|nr:Protein transport protein sec31 [Smittium mucronatum]